MKLRILSFVCFTLVAASVMMSFEVTNVNDRTGVDGAWSAKTGNEHQLLLIKDGYFTSTVYDLANKKFINTSGGSFSVKNNKFLVNGEFDTKNAATIGAVNEYPFTMKENTLLLHQDGKEKTFERIDNGTAPLAGVWHITSRMEDGKLNAIHRSGSRKTLKILTATKFQWIAIDPGKKEFLGTGGGSYSFNNGTYTEHIEFFSRDNSRVGASLSFQGKIEGKDWHHSGLSSKGDKIYEIWGHVNE